MSANLTGLERAAWMKYLLGKDPDLQSETKHAWSNGFIQRFRTSVNDDSVLDGIGSDNNNNVFAFGAKQVPYREQENFALQPNALQGTQPFWISDGYYYVTAVALRFHVACTTAGTVTGQITIDRSTAAPGAGTSLMSNTFNLKGTIDTNQNATLAAGLLRNTIANAKLTNPVAPYSAIVIRPGDRLSFNPSTQTLTSLAGVIVSVTFAPSGVTNNYVYYQNSASLVVTSPFAAVSRPGFVVQNIYVFASAAASGACTLNVTADADGTAAGGGNALLNAAVNLNTIVPNTLVTPALTATVANLTLPYNARLSVLLTGSTTGLAGLVVLVSTSPSNFQEFQFNQASNANLGTNQSIAGPFDRDYIFDSGYASIETAAGGAYTVALTADAPGVAPGAGNIMQTDNTNAGFSLNGTPATLAVATLADRRLRYLPAGYTIGLKFAGTKGATAGLVIGGALRPV